jgi:hypothetical protein
MTGLMASEDRFRTLLDRDPIRDMCFLVFPGISSVFALAMAPDQEVDKTWDITVNPLINGLMANG